MASAVEMLSGEKNRLPVWLRNWPYNSMANALLPRAASARSDVAVAGTSAARKATGRTRQVLSNDLSGFIRISITCHNATKWRGQPPLSAPHDTGSKQIAHHPLPIEFATKRL